MTGSHLLPALAGLAAGGALGGIYFALLARTARLHAEGGPAAAIAGLYALRLGLAATVFWAIAQTGALPLVLALLGFLAARSAVGYRLGALR